MNNNGSLHPATVLAHLLSVTGILPIFATTFLKYAFTIRQFRALVLLLTFVTSVLPKTFFHDWLAGHTDTVSCAKEHQGKACMQTQGVHCSFDELVVQSPFTYQNVFSPPLPTLESIAVNSYAVEAILPSACFAKTSRGPPAAAFLYS